MRKSPTPAWLREATARSRSAHTPRSTRSQESSESCFSATGITEGPKGCFGTLISSQGGCEFRTVGEISPARWAPFTYAVCGRRDAAGISGRCLPRRVGEGAATHRIGTATRIRSAQAVEPEVDYLGEMIPTLDHTIEMAVWRYDESRIGEPFPDGHVSSLRHPRDDTGPTRPRGRFRERP